MTVEGRMQSRVSGWGRGLLMPSRPFLYLSILDSDGSMRQSGRRWCVCVCECGDVRGGRERERESPKRVLETRQPQKMQWEDGLMWKRCSTSDKSRNDSPSLSITLHENVDPFRIVKSVFLLMFICCGLGWGLLTKAVYIWNILYRVSVELWGKI